MKKLLGGVIAATAIALTTAPTASADNDSYLQRLNNEYGNVYDTGLALSTGYEICSRLDYENGADTVNWLYSWGSADIPTTAAAAQWLMIAVEELCPWHDHRAGQLLYAS